MRTFTFASIAAYKAAKASGGAIYAALVEDATLKSGAVVSKITSTGDVLIDALNPFVTPNLATNKDTLYYSSTEGYRSLRKGSTTWDANSLNQIYIDTSRLPSGFAVVEAYNDVFTFKSMQGETTGSGRSKMTSIRGNSVAWNQLVQNGNFADGGTGWINGRSDTTVSTNGIVITNSTGSYASVKQTIPFVNGHKYYCFAFGSVSEGTIELITTISGSGYNNTARLQNGVCKYVHTASANNDGVAIMPTPATTNSGTVKLVQVVDLTLLYGSAIDGLTDEQILVKFESEFPLGYYAYNAGTLISNKAKAIEFVGFNQWDEQWELGGFTPTDGTKTNAFTNRIRSKNYIQILPDTSYYTKVALFVFQYDASKSFLSYEAVNNGLLNLNSACRYINISTNPSVAVVTTYNHDICINLSDAAKNGTYEPYKKVIVPLNLDSFYVRDSNGVRHHITGGLKSAGSVYDEIVENKYIRRVGSVDLGDLSYSYDSSGVRFATDISSYGVKNVSSWNGAGSICEKYVVMRVPSDGSGDDKILGLYGTSVYIRDTSYTDSATFKTEMNGEKLYYELANPEVFELEYPITPIIYPAKGGTKRILPVNGSSPVTAPFSCVVQPI